MNDCSCPSRGETPHSIDCPADVWHMMPPESLRERLAADVRLWNQAYAEGLARGRAEVAAKVEVLVETFDIAQPRIAAQLRDLVAEAS